MVTWSLRASTAESRWHRGALIRLRGTARMVLVARKGIPTKMILTKHKF